MKKSFLIYLTVFLVIAFTVSLSSCNINNSGIDDVKRAMQIRDEVDNSLLHEGINLE